MAGWLSPDNVSGVTRILDLSGVFVNGTLGGVLARERRLDLFGFLVIGVVSGLGGGILRDVLLQRGTPVALTDYTYLAVAAVGTLLAFVADLSRHTSSLAFNLLDASALSVWAVAGAQKTLAAGLGWLPAVLLGTLTAVGGGAVRDLMLGRIPGIFGGTPLYATVAVVVSAVMVTGSRLGAPTAGIVAGVAVGVAFRLAAVSRGWMLPRSRDWRPPSPRVRPPGPGGAPRSATHEQEGTAMAPRDQGEAAPAPPGPGSVAAGGPGPGAGGPRETVLGGLDAVRAELEDLYRDLHAHPELGHQERRTAAAVAEQLRRSGYRVHEGVGGTGVVGVLANGPGPAVLLRADMDALPVREETGLPYASTATASDASGRRVPVAHACGHDMHTACLVGAARLMAAAPGAWRGTLIALFQPAEEPGDGADGMLADALAERIPRPDAAFAQHLLPFPAGLVLTRAGSFLSAADNLRITLHGRGAHGSAPQAAIDPVVLAAATVLRLQTIVSRELAATTPAVLTVGSVQAGATGNVIPDTAELLVNVRSYDEPTRLAVLAAVRRIVRAECAASGTEREPLIEEGTRFPPTVNDEALTREVAAAFTAVFGDRAGSGGPQSASEDFSRIPDALGAPYTYWGLGCVDPDAYRDAERRGRLAQDVPVNHSPRFAPALQPTLDTGVQALVTAALTRLAVPEPPRP